ncbi:hypothetical protein ACMS1L_002394 [Cronobacter turicensis]
MENIQKSFEEAAAPLIKWLAENANPHSSVIVTSESAELLSGVMAVKTNEHSKE